jgi:hypothetical protein
MSNFVFGQENAGYIIYSKVLDSFPLHLENMKKIEDLKTKFNDSINNLIKPFVNRTSGTCTSYSKEELEENRKALIKLQETFEKFRKYALGVIKDEKDRLEKRTEKEISYFMKEFRALKQILFLSKKTDLIYCRNCQDYTEEFIKYINNTY